MSDEFKLFMKNTYSPKMKHYHRRAYWHQRGARSMKPAIILFSLISATIATILAILEGLAPEISLILKIAAALFSAVSAALSALLKEGDHEKKWKEYDKLYKALKEELDYYRMGGGKYKVAQSIEDRNKLLVERFYAICKAGEENIEQLTVSPPLEEQALP